MIWAYLLDLYVYAKKNLLWLNVYVKDSFATRIVRDERMTVTSFVANVGGLLGLCMGFRCDHFKRFFDPNVILIHTSSSYIWGCRFDVDLYLRA